MFNHASSTAVAKLLLNYIVVVQMFLLELPWEGLNYSTIVNMVLPMYVEMRFLSYFRLCINLSFIKRYVRMILILVVYKRCNLGWSSEYNIWIMCAQNQFYNLSHIDI